MQEIWKDIQGYNGVYQVSNMGRVRSFKSRSVRILKGHKNHKGYRKVELSISANRKHFFVHRLVGFAFCGGYKEGLQVDHINGTKTDNRAINLRWVTHRQNQEAYRSNRSVYGIGIRKRGQRFRSEIQMNNTKYYIGTYDTPEQAQQARTDFKAKHNIK
ncbi:MAG: NUMOD4 motif-containing HNH endonuclease [Saprospiraceae bacterium]|uniref:NUMOD4 motif-containing HNH endonuclease n=1 Tax=Kordia sp. TaxID=1965332 RepID=UPI0025BE7C4A|nr:NUMOD4 motif-containing HNH endonuclease [Kordia sp.]MCH2045665.1 NUMOD4 motif-containing HNH endonuclease [Saprospiraceae bacterium]MCH2197076.1 NUMOD4 motif-containing HNH endonuclease [Kordia sp.]